MALGALGEGIPQDKISLNTEYLFSTIERGTKVYTEI